MLGKKMMIGVVALFGVANMQVHAQDPVVVVQPQVTVNLPELKPKLQTPVTIRPDAKKHLAVVIRVTKNAVTATSIKSGDGPPRAYLSARTDLVILIKDRLGKVLSRTNLPDPLELRVWNNPIAAPTTLTTPVRSRTAKRTASTTGIANSRRETVVHLPSAKIEIFLPMLEEATVLEFHSHSESGELLGSRRLALVETPVR